MCNTNIVLQQVGRECIVREYGWEVRAVSQYIALYCDQQGLVARKAYCNTLGCIVN